MHLSIQKIFLEWMLLGAGHTTMSKTYVILAILELQFRGETKKKKKKEVECGYQCYEINRMMVQFPSHSVLVQLFNSIRFVLKVSSHTVYVVWS